MRTPLNGTKTHPLTKHGIAELRRIAEKPRPITDFNPGTRDRLTRDEPPLVRVVMVASPFKSGPREVGGYEITDACRRELAAADDRK